MLTHEQAVKIAQERLSSARGPAALVGRRELVKRIGDTWHVSFPWSDPDMLGGEPHVVINDEGKIVEFYSTQ
jgi:hypothetical protein